MMNGTPVHRLGSTGLRPNEMNGAIIFSRDSLDGGSPGKPTLGRCTIQQNLTPRDELSRWSVGHTFAKRNTADQQHVNPNVVFDGLWCHSVDFQMEVL